MNNDILGIYLLIFSIILSWSILAFALWLDRPTKKSIDFIGGFND